MSILTGIKFGLVGLLCLWMYHLGGDAARLATEKLKTAQAQNTANAVLAERASTQAQAKTDQTAEAQHDQTIESLPARVVRTPVWLRAPGDVCPAVPIPPQAAGHDPGSGGVQPGPGERDIRPGLEALKIKYETALADCRRLDAEWPK
jgi:hypothetical protein